MKSYKILKKNVNLYKNIEIAKIYLPSFYAGPNEAFLQASYLDNLGFKYFLVGRDHAGFKNFFKKYESQNIFKKLKNLNIKIIKTKEPLMCVNCNKIGFEDKKFCKCFGRRTMVSINGKDIKRMLKLNKLRSLKKFTNIHIFEYLKKNRKKIDLKKGLDI